VTGASRSVTLAAHVRCTRSRIPPPLSPGGLRVCVREREGEREREREGERASVSLSAYVSVWGGYD